MKSTKRDAPASCVVYRRNANGELVPVPQNKIATEQSERDAYTDYTMRQGELGQPRGRWDY